MNTEKLVNAIGEIDEELIYNAANDTAKVKTFPWKKLIPVAACLCVAAAIWAALPFIDSMLGTAESEAPQSPEEPREPGTAVDEPHDLPPSFTYNGNRYIISSYASLEEELPEGFAFAGETTTNSFEGPKPFYVNPDIPEWIYVYQEVRTTGEVDENNTLIPAEPHGAYVLYVDSRLRGKHLINYEGEMYISLWDAYYYGDTPDVTEEYYNSLAGRYGIRIEGEAPAGFVLAGKRIFIGLDTVPQNSLETNALIGDIYYSNIDSNIIIASTSWNSINGIHRGFDVYIKYDCPFITEE